MSIGASAVRAAEAVGYYNAGTVEFIYDTLTEKFYFMEMNTRLQVEHPISEEITGQDFVEWQLRVAAGEKLPLRQDQLKITGHALEARIYAEDPDMGFLPQSGKIHYLREPNHRNLKVGADPAVRVDTGIVEGDEVSIFFDPMISKLIVHGSDRPDAIRKMKIALDNYKIVGLKNNIDFQKRILETPDFLNWEYDTDFIVKNEEFLLGEKFTATPITNSNLINATLITLIEEREKIAAEGQNGNPWEQHDGFRVNYALTRSIQFEQGDSSFSV